MFAELELGFFPNYCYIYYPRRETFAFTLMTVTQRSILETLSNFYSESHSPVVFSSSMEEKEFAKGVDICWKLYKQMVKYLAEHPTNFGAIDKSLDKHIKKLEKYFDNITLKSDIYSILDELQPLNTALKAGAQSILKNYYEELHWAFCGKNWEPPTKIQDIRALDLTIYYSGLFIFPKMNTTILLLRIHEPKITSNEFKYFETFYLLTRKLLKILQDPELFIEDLNNPEKFNKNPCKICSNTGICFECGGLGEIESDKGNILICPNCKGLGSCICERV